MRPRRVDYTAALLLFALALQGSAAIRPAKVLLVVAHPDDEYNFAATTYRIARELGGAVDEVVITDGEGGYRYALLAEKIYGLPLTSEHVGRTHLPVIRRQETLRAGRILGIRHHYFLNQKDQAFTLDATSTLNSAWDIRLRLYTAANGRHTRASSGGHSAGVAGRCPASGR
jgi:N-acetylglucosamine malate deacetylase 2